MQLAANRLRTSSRRWRASCSAHRCTVRARRGHSIELHTSRQIERIVQTRDRVRAVCVRRYGMPGHRQDKCKKRYRGTYRATTA